MPRYSSDPKETTVKLRLNDEMRRHVERSAKSKGITMSEYLRNLIKNDMKNRQPFYKIFPKNKKAKTSTEDSIDDDTGKEREF